MSDHESDSVRSQDKEQGSAVPEGRPKSGRTWKKKQVYRSSTQTRQGVLSHLAKTKAEKDAERQKLKAVRELEREMKEATKNKKIEARLKREEQEKRRMANEYKTAVYQTINAEKIKGMSKKQLRNIKKTAMNKNGQIELVNPWSGR